MKDARKTKDQLIAELSELRQRNTELDKLNIECKTVEEKPKISKERFARALQATKDGIWEWDIITNMEFFSPRWCEIIGYSFDDSDLPHTFDSWSSRIHPDDKEYVLAAVKAHLDENKEYNVDYRHLHKSGEYRFQNSRGQALFDEKGKPVKMVGCIRDITERKKAEEALLLSEKQTKEALAELSQLYKTTPVGLCLLDIDRRYVRINQTLADINGKSIGSHIGITYRELLPEVADQIDLAFNQVVESGKPVLNIEHSGSTPKNPNNHRSWLTNFYPFKVDDEVSGVGVVVQDITERKKMETVLKASEAKLKKQKAELEKKNITLRGVIEHVEIEKMQIREQLDANIDKLIMPILYGIKGDRDIINKKIFNVLEQSLKNLTTPFAAKITSAKLKLSPREIEICNMIKGGIVTKEIAIALGVTVQTILTHRRNIRKKLQLDKKKINLSSYLQSI